MKIAFAQNNYHIGNFSSNTEKIIQNINDARDQGAELILFSELAVCGYHPYDLLERKEFIEEVERRIEEIKAASKEIAVIIGAPSINYSRRGKKLYNSAFFINDGKIEEVIHKTLLPTYDIFDEYRHFEPNKEFKLIEYKGKKIAITICEDLWNDQPTANAFAKSELYITSPMKELSKLNPDFVVNIAASPFSYNQAETRKKILIKNAEKYHIPICYCNQVGGQTEVLFDGGSMIVDATGNVVKEMTYFKEDFRIFDLNDGSRELQPATDYIEKIHDALVMGIHDYFQKMGFKKATLGLSGGIDSAVTVVLAARALGPENIRVLLMPSQYSSDHSVTDAIKLAENLGIQYDIVKIKDIFNQFAEQLSPIFKDHPFDVTEENIQARIRGILMMAVSNKFGHILLNTSNKSESAVGYGTLYGDMNGGISVLGDVYKSDVFKLAWFMNKDKEVIPVNTIVKPPSAELRPDQKDSDSLPDYDTLDAILFDYIELNLSPDEIVAKGYNRAIVERTARMVNNNEYKRFQTPPILRISSKAFGFGRRIPLVAKFY